MASEHELPTSPRGDRGTRTFWIFSVLMIGNIGVSLYVNSAVLTDGVYTALLSGAGSTDGVATTLAAARRWERLGYLFSPVALFLRLGWAALLTQFALVILGRRVALGRVFRAATWAALVPLLGALAQALRLSLLPPAARTEEQLRVMPGAIVSLFSMRDSFSPALLTLLEHITIFDLGWIILFALALEDARDLPGPDAVAAVTSVWTLSILAEWGFWLYLSGVV